MIEEYAVITEVTEGFAMLEIERQTACGLCGQKRGCGNATWGKFLGHRQHGFRAKNPINANVGDSVVVGVDERAMLSSVFYLYIVPLITMFISAILVDTIFNHELYVLLAAMLGLLLGFIWVKGHLVGYGEVKNSRSTQYDPVILRLAENASECENEASSSSKGPDDVSMTHKQGVNVVKFETKRGE